MQENTHPRSLRRQIARSWIAFACVLAVLDWILKSVAILHFPSETAVATPIGFALHKNPGIIFDIPVPLPLVVVLSLGVCAYLLLLAHRTYPARPRYAAALTVIVIGALGNALDRVIHGFTTDYVILFGASAINIADILILAGVLGALYYSGKQAPVPPRKVT